jgi:hypothetical protein
MKIRARLLEMAADEITQLIPSRILADIKRNDPHPTFRAYVIGHEGESKGKVMLDGEKVSIVKRWVTSAIQKLHDKIRVGLQLFHGHSYDNSQDGRTAIGEVVAKTMKTIKDALSSIVIAYIKPEFKNLPLDVASIEADVNLQSQGGEIYADVHDLHAIALGNSATETPGFAGATLLAQVQEFAANTRQFTLKRVKVDEMTEISIDDIRQVIKAEKINPGDLFTMGALSEDPSVQDLIKSESRSAQKGEYEHRKRTDKKFDEEREKWEAEKKELEGQIKALKPKAIQNDRDAAFKKIADSRKLDEKEIKFINRKLGGFTPEKMEDLDKELDTFVDTQLEDFKVIATDLGITLPNKDGAGADGKGSQDNKPDLGAGKETNAGDVDMIPGT